MVFTVFSFLFGAAFFFMGMKIEVVDVGTVVVFLLPCASLSECDEHDFYWTDIEVLQFCFYIARGEYALLSSH